MNLHLKALQIFTMWNQAKRKTTDLETVPNVPDQQWQVMLALSLAHMLNALQLNVTAGRRQTAECSNTAAVMGQSAVSASMTSSTVGKTNTWSCLYVYKFNIAIYLWIDNQHWRINVEVKLHLQWRSVHISSSSNQLFSPWSKQLCQDYKM